MTDPRAGRAAQVWGSMLPLASGLSRRALAAVNNVLLLINLALFLLAAAALLWFLYRVFLRRILRARRIANVRLRRIIEEQGKSGAEQSDG